MNTTKLVNVEDLDYRHPVKLHFEAKKFWEITLNRNFFTIPLQ